MKSKTYFIKNDNSFEVFFTYEDYDGEEIFGTWDELVKSGLFDVSGEGCISCYMRSYLWGVTELYDYIYIDGKPTIADLRKFIGSCLSGIEESGAIRVSSEEFFKNN